MEQPLTREQLGLVVHLANGLTQAEIARCTHRSESSVNKMLNTARRRAGAKTMPHLISIVIASGVLEWTPDRDRAINGSS